MKNLVNEAAMAAVREGKRSVAARHFEDMRRTARFSLVSLDEFLIPAAIVLILLRHALPK